MTEPIIIKYKHFDKCDILIHKNDIEYRGFDKTKQENEMIKLAIENDCPIIIKNGYNGKWYLKGKGFSKENLMTMINQAVGNSRDGVYCLLLEKN